MIGRSRLIADIDVHLYWFEIHVFHVIEWEVCWLVIDMFFANCNKLFVRSQSHCCDFFHDLRLPDKLHLVSDYISHSDMPSYRISDHRFHRVFVLNKIYHLRNVIVLGPCVHSKSISIFLYDFNLHKIKFDSGFKSGFFINFIFFSWSVFEL